jgi:hypothetical protein
MGMASACHTVYRQSAHALVTVSANGTAHVAAGATDIGTGTVTFLRQITADALGLPIDKVAALIGDSGLPEAPMQAGASLTSSLGSATLEAAQNLVAKLIGMAISQNDSPLCSKKWRHRQRASPSSGTHPYQLGLPSLRLSNPLRPRSAWNLRTTGLKLRCGFWAVHDPKRGALLLS